MTQDAISCDLHDFVEVACMYGYQLKLILKNDQIIEGKAIDIVNSPEKNECLVIDSDTRQQVELIRLAKMEVLTPSAKFSEVIFP
ncbi:Rho-binding antiterminator [Nitrosomonas oligotropha]|uniref:Transcriptional antiterminator, Rof n=1 Tax=Nitrosomonas oligotropha TaxID=42354 RepID=A0A1H8PHT8_9PROT|nr:Rho-binding antiterminator [Nitrosomonas oligotropha]SDW78660.1 transcriptional antiterminator, Rof [Nitrosomonas oligotropha]SEO41277.1 transcriptional antiterminator, Rof [Nitrosomonas oligotropha]